MSGRPRAHGVLGAGAERRVAHPPFLWSLAAIALVGLGVRLFYVFVGNASYVFGGDAVYYHYEAWTLADGKGFIDPFRWLFLHQVSQSAVHPPLYSMYLSLVSRLGFWSVTDHRVASTVLGAAVVVIVGLTGRRVGGVRVGLVAATFAAVYANLWINDGMLLSESMSALTISLVLLSAYALWERPDMTHAIWFGLALGAAIMSRAEVAILAPILIVTIVLCRHDVTARTRAQLAAVSGAMVVVCVGPWIGYNLSRFDKPVYMTDSVGAVLSAASCDATYYGSQAGWYGSCHVFGARPIRGDASDVDAAVRKEAVDYIKTHKSRLPVVMLERVGRMWDVWKPRQNVRLNGLLEGRTIGASQIALGSYYFLMPLAVAGVVVMRRRHIPISPIVAPAVVVTVAAAMFFGAVRYRVSAEPAIVVAAAISVDVLWISLVDRRKTLRPSARHVA